MQLLSQRTNQVILCSKILPPLSSVSMFSVVTGVDVDHSRAVPRGFRPKGLSWEIPIPFFRFLRHHDRLLPFAPFPIISLHPARVIWFIPVLWFAPTARLDAKLILFLALLERLVHGPRPMKKVLGGIQPPFVCCVLDGLYSSGPCFPPITLQKYLSHYSC